MYPQHLAGAPSPLCVLSAQLLVAAALPTE